MADVQSRIKISGDKIPNCTSCGHFLLPDTLQFGKPLDHATLESAQLAAADCDLFICIGSSLLVQPANLIPAIAINMNIPFVILNKTYTLSYDVIPLYHIKRCVILYRTSD